MGTNKFADKKLPKSDDKSGANCATKQGRVVKEVPHSFFPSDAAQYGVHAALMLFHMRFWIEQNIIGKRNHYDGRTWTYNSIKEYASLYPYFTDKQIRSALNKLVQSGVLLKGNYNKAKYDQTSWYAFADETQFIQPDKFTYDPIKP